MAGTQRKWYVEPNDTTQSYDIMKRDGVQLEDGTLQPEKVCSIYSMEYLDAVLAALEAEDAKDAGAPVTYHSPVFEG